MLRHFVDLYIYMASAASNLSIPKPGGGASTGESGAEGCPSSTGRSLPQLAADETATKADGLPLGVSNSGIVTEDPTATRGSIIRGGGDLSMTLGGGGPGGGASTGGGNGGGDVMLPPGAIEADGADPLTQHNRRESKCTRR